ncbi:hypothetical protein FGB62_182g162 [Gracilaria domingensis]|nr:hypothetical protein FGB62_182g162 [Gracilaria domingensis]
MEAKADARKLAMEHKRKARDNTLNLDKNTDPNAVPPSQEELQGINWFKPRSAMNADGDAENGSSGIRAPTFKTYVPPRKPKGPDGTVGFTARMELREKQQGDLDAPNENDDSASDHADASESKPHSEADENSQDGDSETDADGSCLEKSDSSDSSPTKSGKGAHRVLNPNGGLSVGRSVGRVGVVRVAERVLAAGSGLCKGVILGESGRSGVVAVIVSVFTSCSAASCCPFYGADDAMFAPFLPVVVRLLKRFVRALTCDAA